jgi:predicted phage terminase large subunit-like protein
MSHTSKPRSKSDCRNRDPPIKDKRARLRVAARYIKNGTVKFPRSGCERLLTQLFGFGPEKHDDAVDALVWLIVGVAKDGIEQPVVHYV